MNNELQGVIVNEEGDFLVIKINGDQELYWPKNLVNFNYSLGDKVNLILKKAGLITNKDEIDPKKILSQIFQPNV